MLLSIYFNPRAPCGARRKKSQTFWGCFIFQSTRPMRGATLLVHMAGIGRPISIHAPHAGRDIVELVSPLVLSAFQSTRPMRGATFSGLILSAISKFQSTRPMRGATIPAADVWAAIGISIHAPHAGRDEIWGLPIYNGKYFNPRAPCGARRLTEDDWRAFAEFQSTRPMRGATTPRIEQTPNISISIHAPHAGRDLMRKAADDAGKPLFQSTRPMRGATERWHPSQRRGSISIHAPHAGRDSWIVKKIGLLYYFNPRAPCGARRIPNSSPCPPPGISIHAPHAGRDYQKCGSFREDDEGISIHAPHAGRDLRRGQWETMCRISIHAPHAGRDARLFVPSAAL